MRRTGHIHGRDLLDRKLEGEGAVGLAGKGGFAGWCPRRCRPSTPYPRSPARTGRRHVILTAAALALTASVRRSSSETRTAPARLFRCFKEIIICKDRPFQPQSAALFVRSARRGHLLPAAQPERTRRICHRKNNIFRRKSQSCLVIAFTKPFHIGHILYSKRPQTAAEDAKKPPPGVTGGGRGQGRLRPQSWGRPSAHGCWS